MTASRTTTLTLIGYWAGQGVSESLPHPETMVDEYWDAEERDLVADYLRSGVIVRAFMGYSPCRVCGANNGSLERSDGSYAWPEGLAHYVADHHVRLPAPFVEHVVRIVDTLDSADFDLTWWKQVTT